MRREMAIVSIAMMVSGCAGPCGSGNPTPSVAQPAPQSETAKALSARIETLRAGGRRDVPYEPPAPAEEKEYTKWVQAVALAASAGQEPTGDPPRGFVLERIQDVWLLAEKQDHRRGAGAVAIRVGQALPVLIEAPHTFFDLGSLPVALAAFDAGHCRALLVSTVHRYALGRGDTGSDDDGSQDSVSDVAHAQSSFFLAAHRALLAAFQGAWTVQFHGFANDRAPGVDVILSPSVTKAPISPVAERARTVIDDVRIFPDEIRVLGALTNVEALSSRDMGAPFLHVEMSRELRDRLAADESLLRRMAVSVVPVVGP